MKVSELAGQNSVDMRIKEMNMMGVMFQVDIEEQEHEGRRVYLAVVIWMEQPSSCGSCTPAKEAWLGWGLEWKVPAL